jgi:hypothetical protein
VQREEGYDLFGEERGYILTGDVSKVELVGDAESATFRITTSDSTR